MSKVETVPVAPTVSAQKESSKKIGWKHFARIVVALVVALIPAPAGLPQYAWYYFAIFCRRDRRSDDSNLCPVAPSV